MSKATQVIRSIYFYAVSIIALFMLVFSAVDLVNLGLKTWVFKNADNSYYECMPGSYAGVMKPTSISEKDGSAVAGPTQEECDRQNEQNRKSRVRQNQASAVRDLSMLVVALPLFIFHFRIVQKEWKERKEA